MTSGSGDLSLECAGFFVPQGPATRLVKENNLYDYKYGQPALHRFCTKGHHPAGHEPADGGKLSVWLAGGNCRRFEPLLSEAFIGISRPLMSTAAHLIVRYQPRKE
jgi:hypothetical protein